MELFDRIIRFFGAVVWGPHMVLLLLGVGFYLTIRLRFLQFRGFGLSVRLVLGGRGYGEKREGIRGDISPFQALTTSLAATIGNGNIAGVCTAIAMGGPGAVFWMWMSAFFGMATKIVEAALGQKFKQFAADGTVLGGPMYYIRNGLGLSWLAAIFAFFMGSKALFGTTLIQSNSISLALKTQVGIEPWITGAGLALLVWLVIIGGIKSIARVTVFLSPFMVLVYIGGALVTVLAFASQIPQAFSLIFVGAFKPSAVGGGVVGATVAGAIRYGLARGAYSNEAGTGTAAVFHAAAKTGEPARQGMIASLDVFIDTIVVCTLTALAVLVTGAWTEGTSTQMAVNAFNAAMPAAGGLIVAVSSFLFGYSTLVANPYYGEISFCYLIGEKTRTPFRWLYCLMIFVGSALGAETAWSVGDVFNGMMAFCNLIGLIGLSNIAVRTVNEYIARQRRGPGA
ncbi:MAG: sodium:alanine symporter family protein [Candidatus Aminicenantales bacterium]